MRVNLKKEPKFGHFIFNIIIYPVIVLLTVLLTESLMMRFISFANRVSYSLLWFVTFLVTVIFSFCYELLDFKVEYKCINCLVINEKKDTVFLGNKKTKEFHDINICFKCIKKLRDKVIKK